MTEAITAFQYLFRKFFNFIFSAQIVPNVTLGYVLLGILIMGILIGTLSPRVIGGNHDEKGGDEK